MHFFYSNKLWLTLRMHLFFFPLRCSISTHGMAFSAAGLPLPVPTVIFETLKYTLQCFWMAAFLYSSLFFFFLRNLAKGQVLDSGNNKRWKNFFEGHFLYFCLPSCDRIIFYSFFPCSIAKILVVLQAFETLEAPFWLHFSILAKHIFIPCFKNPLYPFLMFQD